MKVKEKTLNVYIIKIKMSVFINFLTCYRNKCFAMYL